MCRREAVHHRLCGHVLVHRKRCTCVLNSRTPQKWCFPSKQREVTDHCKRCRRERDDRTAAKEERKELDERRKSYKAERRAIQDERWRREEMGARVSWGRMESDGFRGRGVRVPGGRLEWHPKTRSFLEKIGNLFRGGKRDREELFRGGREDREGESRDREYDDYYSGEDEVSRSGSLTTASTRQRSVATSALGGPSRGGSRVLSRTASRQPSRRPTVGASFHSSATSGSRRSTPHSSAPSSARSRNSTARSRASSQATIQPKPTKPVPQDSFDYNDISPLMDGMDDDDLLDEDYASISHGRVKKATKWSLRDIQAESEQSRYRDDYHCEEEEHWSTGPNCVLRAPRGRTLQNERETCVESTGWPDTLS